MNYTNIFRVESKEKNLFGKTGTVYSAYDRSGNKVPAKFIPTSLRKEAFTNNKAIAVIGSDKLTLVDIKEFDTANIVEDSVVEHSDKVSVNVPEQHAEVMNFIHSSYSLKPKGLMMKEL